ncbi:MAG: hypothetical protein K2P58_13370 [Hyphomonadaceae bacterium]|nr:hypothetical protein [Hyphomonadaceae bacterium]
MCDRISPARGEPSQVRWSAKLATQLRAHMRPLRGGVRDLPGAMLPAAVHWRWRRRRRSPRHDLTAPLIVSLTSYRPRFATLALTLKCLLTQSVSPDRVRLWIARDDWAALPEEVLALRAHGLDVRRTQDVRSFKKIVPELALSPNANIVIADDDVYYPSNWLAELIDDSALGAREIPAGRVHRIRLLPSGAPAPYVSWDFDIEPGPASPLNIATGVGGVLYPPGSLHPDVLHERLFMRLCPTNDDLWLYFMARRAGWRVRKVGPRRLFFSWPGTQRTALQHLNLAPGAGNDVHLQDLIAHFGSPFTNAAGPAPQLLAHDHVRVIKS